MYSEGVKAATYHSRERPKADQAGICLSSASSDRSPSISTNTHWKAGRCRRENNTRYGLGLRHSECIDREWSPPVDSSLPT